MQGVPRQLAATGEILRL
ncbi:unnamed protein product [Callosobruchus maculatus]|uniref:Uncharacterized protein n=1 Tax=Callosobruchus maculatus TaxID=64391 RepID=A0A653DSN4_CALMS|nr:unnamed protein product [Callosobruchus maculatus]